MLKNLTDGYDETRKGDLQQRNGNYEKESNRKDKTENSNICNEKFIKWG